MRSDEDCDIRALHKNDFIHAITSSNEPKLFSLAQAVLATHDAVKTTQARLDPGGPKLAQMVIKKLDGPKLAQMVIKKLDGPKLAQRVIHPQMKLNDDILLYIKIIRMILIENVSSKVSRLWGM